MQTLAAATGLLVLTSWLVHGQTVDTTLTFDAASFSDAAECAAPNSFVGEFGEPSLDQIHP